MTNDANSGLNPDFPAALPGVAAMPAFAPARLRPYVYLAALVAGYIGVYLCRKNLSVAVPVIQKEWGLSKESIGVVASISTIAYASGKFLFGPVVDRFGGRNSFLVSMLLVALFGALGAFAPSLSVLTLLYSANRLTGSASWGAMVKQVPEWYGATQLPFALGVLSLSFVFGGAIAVSIAGVIARESHDNWHAIMGLPSILLVLIALLCWAVLPRGSQAQDRPAPAAHDRRLARGNLRELLFDPQFHIICALSFTLTFLRETFNFWTVDFVKTEAGRQLSSGAAALMSTPFDVFGGAGILWLGWIYTRIGYALRMRLLFGNLFLLAVLLYFLPNFFHWGSGLIMTAIGAIGFLVYGPYSLLAGVLSVEVRGKESAATVSGWVDGVGYFAAVLSGGFFGRLLGQGGYRLGFQFMAGLCLVSAVLCLFLYPKSKFTDAKS